MEIQDLVNQAKAVLREERDTDLFVDKVADYSAAFGIWYSANKESLSGEVSPQERERLQGLLDYHEQVMEIAAQMKEHYRGEITDFRKRTKGILAYVDVLPKRISISKKRKG